MRTKLRKIQHRVLIHTSISEFYQLQKFRLYNAYEDKITWNLTSRVNSHAYIIIFTNYRNSVHVIRMRTKLREIRHCVLIHNLCHGSLSSPDFPASHNAFEEKIVLNSILRDSNIWRKFTKFQNLLYFVENRLPHPIIDCQKTPPSPKIEVKKEISPIIDFRLF